ncbi:MAG: GIY-YIG nuclease family protein [Lentisphaerae bacterium]|nr:GIY-YIG nuclease family protein [Lentisphaerota bacterium]
MATPTYFVYILQSLSSGQYYIGSTDHLVRRFRQHQTGISLATRGRGPWWLPYYEIYHTRAEAVRRERELKGKKNANSIHRIIQQATGLRQ